MQSNITVIGTVFVDCKGFATASYNPEGRNLGNIQFVHGGVGRNVAENLAYLGIDTSFVTMLEPSALGQEVKERLLSNQIDLTYVQEVAENGMGMWLAILDEHGHLRGSVSKMPNLEHMDKLVQKHLLDMMDASSSIALELDLNKSISSSVTRLAQLRGVPIYGIPGNMDVILSHPEILENIDAFICNEHEAERLLKQSFCSLNRRQQVALLESCVQRYRIKRMVITLGAEGSIYLDGQSGEQGHQPARKVNLVDSTGAGDAFFSGTIAALQQGISLTDAVKWGTDAAACTIQSAESTTPELNRLAHKLVL